MRTIACIVSPFALVAAAACNTSTTGTNDTLQFTPVSCGNPLLGCNLMSGVATAGVIDLEVRGVDGFPTDGLTLVSETPAVATVTAVAGVAVPTWEFHGVGAGRATLNALDSEGLLVDTLSVQVQDIDRLALKKLAGEATGPTTEADVDEAWQIDAGALVSFQVQAIKGDYALIGRLDHTWAFPPGSTLLDSEQSASDRPAGYLYVQPAAGDYTFTVDAGGLSLDVALHAR